MQRTSHANTRFLLIAVTSLSALMLTACGGTKATPTSPSPTSAIATIAAKPTFSVFGSPTTPSNTTTAGSASASTVYTDPQGRFSFTVPAGYQQTPTPPIPDSPNHTMNLVSFAAPDLSRGFVVNVQDVILTDSPNGSVIPNNMTPTQTLDLVTKTVQGAASQGRDYQSLTDKPIATSLGGQPARRLDFLNTQNGKTYHNVVIGTLRGTRYYELSFSIEANIYAADSGDVTTVSSTLVLTG